jgi:hypothetical protein
MDSKRDSRPEILCVVFSFTAIFALIATDTVMAPAALAQSDSSIFLPAVTYPAGVMPTSVAVADVNGDGRPDLVVADTYGSLSGGHGAVSVLLGNGDGTFAAATIYSSGGDDPHSIAIADLNGDGNPDVVVTNVGGVDVLLGNGDGTFQAPVRYNTNGSLTFSVAVGDVNGDGRPDIVVTNFSSSTVAVLLGNGDGTFQPAVIYGSGGLYATSVVLADVNGDGRPDIAVANECDRLPCSHGTVGVLLGNGDGSFQHAKAYNSAGWEFADPSSLAVADVNGDGKPDLLVANGCTSSSSCPSAAVSVLLGNGDGTFRPALTYASGGFSVSVAVADVNGDGHLDVVVADECGPCGVTNGVGVLLGNGDGTFQPVQMYSSGGGNVYAVALADLNGDGKPDAVAVHGNDSTIGVLLNNAPFCTSPPVVRLSATPISLWPPNGKIVPVTVSGTISDTGCTIATASYAVNDEYGQVQPSGRVTLGPGGAFSFPVLLQASRFGTDINGRLYTVTVSASNSDNKTSSRSGAVVVPHDQGH